jgi:hypothetical protein
MTAPNELEYAEIDNGSEAEPEVDGEGSGPIILPMALRRPALSIPRRER